jgi:diadenosine tetraphosphate (Ap4A) HIT family hydrolase
MPSSLAENERAFAILDRYPVTPGHTLVIPKVHASSIFELPSDAYSACFLLLKEVKSLIECEYKPQGFNVGINCGSAAGQTVEHAHIHLIPRYSGDVVNPRGGVRNVIPGKGDY